MFIDLLITLLSVFLMMLPGFISVKRSWLTEGTISELSAFLVRFVYPCLIISSLLNSFDSNQLISLAFLPAFCFFIMFSGYVYGLSLRKANIFDSADERKSFHFQCTINNYSFVPMPIAYAFYGEQGIAAVVYASIGAETAMWTFGIATIKGFSFRNDILKNFIAPPLLALYFSLFLIFIAGNFNFDLKNFLMTDRAFSKLINTIRSFGAATIPMAMLVCGARMALVPYRKLFSKSIILLDASRLIIIPVFAIIVLSLSKLGKTYFDVLAIIAIMPSAVASILICEIYGGDKNFTASSVLTTHLYSLITIPLMFSFSQFAYKLFN